MEYETGHGSGEDIDARRCSEDMQDRFLPVANVGRIMKKVIPGNGKISKDAKETIKECVSEFISFVTGEASDRCQKEKRKTINGDDIIWAITTLGFEDYVVPLKVYLNRYRQITQQQQQQQLVPAESPQQNVLPHFRADHLYSSSTPLLLSHPISSDPNQHNFSLPFSPTSFQRQFQQQDQTDSLEHW